MNPERRAAIVRILEETAASLRASAAEVSEPTPPTSQPPGNWCAMQIVEHVTLAEHGMFRLLNAALPAETSSGNPEREAIIFRRVASREVRVGSPDRVKPTGRFPNLQTALEQFDAARNITLRFARETETDLFSVTAQHPLIGAVNGYEMLLIMAGHARRHAGQIDELVAHRITPAKAAADE